MRQPLIQLEGLEKVFTTDEVETHALSDVHLEIRQGEFVSIGGPSGCGKSTLLSILGLLDTPTAGTYILNAKPASGLRLSERARIRNRSARQADQARQRARRPHGRAGPLGSRPRVSVAAPGLRVVRGPPFAGPARAPRRSVLR